MKFRLVLIIMTIFFIDFFTKKVVIDNFKIYEHCYLFCFLNLIYNPNFGFIFGYISSETNLWKYWFLKCFGILVCIFLMRMIYKKEHCIFYSLIFGGGIGNVFDHLIHGFVIDFIDFHIFSFHFPTFNIADIAIFIGSMLVCFEIF